MKHEQHELAQIITVSRSDFIESDHFEYFKMIGVGCVPKNSTSDLRSLFIDHSSIQDGKHTIFVIHETWSNFSDPTKKAFMDHEFGHIASGQLERARADGEGGAIVIAEWEFEADDYSVKINGKEAMLKALLDALDVLYKNGFDGWADPVIIARLKRLGYVEK